MSSLRVSGLPFLFHANGLYRKETDVLYRLEPETGLVYRFLYALPFFSFKGATIKKIDGEDDRWGLFLDELDKKDTPYITYRKDSSPIGPWSHGMMVEKEEVEVGRKKKKEKENRIIVISVAALAGFIVAQGIKMLMN